MGPKTGISSLMEDSPVAHLLIDQRLCKLSDLKDDLASFFFRQLRELVGAVIED